MDSTFDAANRLIEDPDFTYAYDLNGNLETKTAKVGGAVTDYTWDAEDRLARIDLPGGGFADYVYDGLGRRIQKDVNGTVTRYVYDGAAILLEYDGTNFLLARYTHGPGIDDAVMVERDIDTNGTFDTSERFFYQTDGLGSVTELTDSSGAVTRTIVYDSYGQIAQDTGGVDQPFAYTGRELDAESGLYFYRARYYDSAAGRFLSEDPIGFGAGDGNLYRYVLNNPVNLLDPDGLFHEEALRKFSQGGQSYFRGLGNLATNLERRIFPKNQCVRRQTAIEDAALEAAFKLLLNSQTARDLAFDAAADYGRENPEKTAGRVTANVGVVAASTIGGIPGFFLGLGLSGASGFGDVLETVRQGRRTAGDIGKALTGGVIPIPGLGECGCSR